MKKDDVIEVEGKVMECFKAGKFLVKLDTGQEIMAYLSGKMKKFRIRVLLGDKVTVELSSYDLTIGRITFRSK
jgi:translation initiation factor IF-1|tara:strand:+ start:353 stop:571 length:219 start_codon:yes stop_codon:yes gene_type:complete